jgi:hypothetical protein
MKNDNYNDPAMPFEGGQNNGCQPYVGLTKLEAVASQQMIGMSAGDYISLKDMAEDAINKARALLDAIEEQQHASY